MRTSGRHRSCAASSPSISPKLVQIGSSGTTTKKKKTCFTRILHNHKETSYNGPATVDQNRVRIRCAFSCLNALRALRTRDVVRCVCAGRVSFLLRVLLREQQEISRAALYLLLLLWLLLLLRLLLVGCAFLVPLHSSSN